MVLDPFIVKDVVALAHRVLGEGILPLISDGLSGTKLKEAGVRKRDDLEQKQR